MNLTPTLSEALAAVRANQGPFGGGLTPAELMRVLEWFVEGPSTMALLPFFGDPAAPAYESKCDGDKLRFVGAVSDPSAPRQLGILAWEVDLSPGYERAHLELYAKQPPGPPLSLKPHLRRAYLAFERAGIPVLELEAGLQAGPVYWAGAGVQFRAGRPLLAHLEVVVTLLAGVATPPALASPSDVLAVFPGPKVTIEDAYNASLQVSGAAGSSPWVRNPLDFLRDRLHLPIDAPTSIGRAVLFAISPWNGWVDLSHPGTSDAGFRAFLGV